MNKVLLARWEKLDQLEQLVHLVLRESVVHLEREALTADLVWMVFVESMVSLASLAHQALWVTLGPQVYPAWLD